MSEHSSEPKPTAPVRPRAASGRLRRTGSALLMLASTLGLIAVVGSSCKTQQPAAAVPSLGASLELAAGEVVLVDEAGSERTLLSGTPLPLGATLRTGKGARALVRLSDGARVFMRDDTRLTLDADGGMQLASGQVWVEAPPLEQGREATMHHLGEVGVAVSDGGASLGYREGGEAEIYVAQGLAIVTAPGGRTEVDPGEMAVIAQGAAPTVEPVKYWDDWTGGMGDISGLGEGGSAVGSGSLYAIDHLAGAAAQPLSIQRQTVTVAIAEQIAETEVDQLFFNPAAGDVEGYYWFTVPEDAMLVGFALEVDGQLVEGEVVERRQAAARYEASIQRQVDPALLEWIDARTVRARIYPIPAAGTRRVVIRYQQLLAETEGKLRYRYPMAAPVGRDAATIEEFALQVELRGEMAKQYLAATRSDAKIEGSERDHISMRRSGFTPRSDFELELNRREDQQSKRPPALRIDRLSPGRDQADYVMLRWLPDEGLDLSQAALPRGEVVVVVDTSAGGDSSEHQAKLAVAEALLRSLSADDRFALVAADLGAEVLFPDKELAEATPEAISSALARVADRGAGGATDLGLAFEQAIDRVHGLEQPAIIYIGDGQATSGSVGGEAMAEQLQRAMAGSRARLFTVAVGREVDEALLSKLAEIGGGKSLRVEDPSQAVVQALALSGALKTPTIVDLDVDLGEGMSLVFSNTAGKLSRGEELVMLARTHDDLPETITITGHFAGEDFSQSFASKAKGDEGVKRYVINHDGLVPRLVPRLWARAYVDNLLTDTRGLEAVRGKVISLGYDYGLMTPFTSFLALENERAYAEAGIERRRHDFPQLTDAGWSRLEDGDEPDPSAGELLLGAASAPFGCGMDEAAEQAVDRSQDSRSRTVEQDLERDSGPSRGPAPSAAPITGKLQAQHAPMDEDGDDGWGRQQGQEFAPQGAEELPNLGRRNARGVFRLDGKSVAPMGGAAKDSATLLAEAGIAGGPPPSWVRESTEAELIRRTLSGQPQVLSSGVARQQSAACSDAATRPLAIRRRLWERQLDRQLSMVNMLQVYEAAAATCEIGRWREQKAFLDLLQARARTEVEIRQLLGHFADDPDAAAFLSQALLRRLVDPGLIAAVVYAEFGNRVDWYMLDGQLRTTDDPQARLELIDQALRTAPGDPDGERRMIRELVAQGRRDEAITRGLSLRDQGSLTPDLVVIVGDLLVAAKRDAEAKRLYSELVEYAPTSIDNRRLLGDLFLRHGWFDDAYRQFELLLTLDERPDTAIRLARAAAGRLHTDEALGLLERVYAGEGRPGVDDPRRWARMHAAVILADLLRAKLDVPKAKIEAELEALNLTEGPATWELLVWNDLGADLVLVLDADDPANAGKTQLDTDRVDAKGTGLYAIQPGGDGKLAVRHAGLVPDRAVAWRRITLRWDGEGVDVSEQTGTIAAQEAKAADASEGDQNDQGEGAGEGAGEGTGESTDDE